MPLGKEKKMKKKLYTKKCAACKLMFRTDNPKQTICAACEKAGRPERKKKKARPFVPTRGISLSELTSALDRYNDRKHTCYTYGQIIVLLDKGEISVKDFLKH